MKQADSEHNSCSFSCKTGSFEVCMHTDVMDMQDMILVAAIYMKHEESTFEGCI
jgi:hypothetical protein